MPRSAFRVITLLLLIPGALSAQTATTTAREFFRAATAGLYPAMAAYIDSTSMAALRRESTRTLRTMTEVMSPPSRAAIDSLAPPALATMMAGLDAFLKPEFMIGMTFARVTSLAQLDSLSDRELTARWLEAKSPRHLAGLAAATAGGMLPPALADRTGSTMAAVIDSLGNQILDWQVLGELAEGPDVAHVVYRVYGQTPPAPTGTLTFRRSGTRWYVHFESPDDQLAAMSTLMLRTLMARAGGG